MERDLARVRVLTMEDGLEAMIHRSPRRRKTVQAHLEDGVLHVFVPDNLSREAESEWVEQMRASITRMQERERASRAIDLQTRARALNKRYFKGLLEWRSIRFTSTSKTRYGSCYPARGEILISAELVNHPRWVLDYVIVHELAHLISPGHDEQFWSLVATYPRAERARGYLDGFSRAHGQDRGRCSNRVKASSGTRASEEQLVMEF